MPPEFRGGRENEPPLRRPGTQPPENRSADDLRVQPFTDDVFSEYQARRKDSSGSSFGLIAGLVIGVAAVGGIGWYMYSTGALTMGGPGGTPQLVKADTEPYKVKPKDPGGMQVENQDKLVYDRVAKGAAPARVENLLPPAEEPKAPPMKKPEPPPVAEAPKPAPAPAKPEPVKAEVVPAEPAKPEPAKTEVAAVEPKPAPEPAKAETPAPAEAAKAPAEPEVDPLAAAVAAATAGRTSATGPINVGPNAAAEAPAETPAETQVAAVPSPAPTAAPAAGGTFHIQLASVLSEEAAQAEWKRVSSKNKGLLGAYAPLITKADLGERGVFYRLRAGPLSDKAAADALCAALEEAKVGCIVIRP